MSGVPGATSSYTMNGGTLVPQDMFVGWKGDGATFTMNDGVIDGKSHLRIGDEMAEGTFNMNGGTATFPAFLLVGHFALAGAPRPSIGHLNITGGTISGANFNLGQHPEAQGIVNQTGGTANATANLVIGETSRKNNLYTISAGVLNVKNTANLANGTLYAGSSAGIGEIQISGTADVNVDGHLFAGSGATSIGTVGIHGGTVDLGLNKPGGGFLVAGEFGVATVTIDAGTTNMDFYQMGRRNNGVSQGQTTQSGGSVTVRSTMTVGGLSTRDNFYDISAGTLNLPGTDTSVDGQPGLHVARFSTGDPAVGPFTPSNARLTISGTAAVTIASGLYNSTGFNSQPAGDPPPPPIPRPGGVGLIEMKAGTLTAGFFVNGAAANAGPYVAGATPASANYVQTGGAASLGHVTGTGNVSVSAGTMNVNSLRQTSAAVSGTGVVTVAPNATATGTSNVGALSISGSAKLDVKDNKLITNTAAGTATGGTYNGVQGMVQSANNFGAWDGPGLTTSMPDAAAGLTTIGVATGEQVRGLGPTDTDTFSGQTINGASTIAMYTYAGDANLDGTIDGGDYGIIDNFVQVPGASGYGNGDFNYDGAIDGGDYGIIDNNVQAQGAPFPTSSASASLSGVTAVPEPSACGVAILTAATGLLGRRRRNRS
jgi:hypothetical protein